MLLIPYFVIDYAEGLIDSAKLTTIPCEWFGKLVFDLTEELQPVALRLLMKRLLFKLWDCLGRALPIAAP